jgi:hypothetical protein
MVAGPWMEEMYSIQTPECRRKCVGIKEYKCNECV